MEKKYIYSQMFAILMTFSAFFEKHQKTNHFHLGVQIK